MCVCVYVCGGGGEWEREMEMLCVLKLIVILSAVCCCGTSGSFLLTPVRERYGAAIAESEVSELLFPLSPSYSYPAMNSPLLCVMLLCCVRNVLCYM